MEKEKCNVRCVEIEGGYKIEVTGLDPKGKSAGCCIPVVIKCGDTREDCRPQEEKKE